MRNSTCTGIRAFARNAAIAAKRDASYGTRGCAVVRNAQWAVLGYAHAGKGEPAEFNGTAHSRNLNRIFAAHMSNGTYKPHEKEARRMMIETVRAFRN